MLHSRSLFHTPFISIMYARKDIPTVLPDAVLRCRKLQAAANIALDDMEKTKFRRMNNLDWQQQTFQRTITERHKRWRVYDRAFRLKLKRELGADLAAALRLRTIQEEEEKFLLEQKLIEQSLPQERKELGKDLNPQVLIDRVTKANSAHPKSEQAKVSTPKSSRSAAATRPLTSGTSKMSQALAAANVAGRLLPKRPRTSRFHNENRRDSDANIGQDDDFGSVLLRILSNIAATPDLDDDFTIRKRALEARERRLIRTRDDRYFKLVDLLDPPKDPESDDEDIY